MLLFTSARRGVALCRGIFFLSGLELSIWQCGNVAVSCEINILKYRIAIRTNMICVYWFDGLVSLIVCTAVNERSLLFVYQIPVGTAFMQKMEHMKTVL